MCHCQWLDLTVVTLTQIWSVGLWSSGGDLKFIVSSPCMYFVKFVVKDCCRQCWTIFFCKFHWLLCIICCKCDIVLSCGRIESWHLLFAVLIHYICLHLLWLFLKLHFCLNLFVIHLRCLEKLFPDKTYPSWRPNV